MLGADVRHNLIHSEVCILTSLRANGGITTSQFESNIAGLLSLLESTPSISSTVRSAVYVLQQSYIIFQRNAVINDAYQFEVTETDLGEKEGHNQSDGQR